VAEASASTSKVASFFIGWVLSGGECSRRL
jgi:hypothetical protein